MVFSSNNSCTSIYLLKMLLFHSNSLKRNIIAIKKLKLFSSKLATLAPDVALRIIKVNKNYSIAQNTTFFIQCCHLIIFLQMTLFCACCPKPFLTLYIFCSKCVAAQCLGTHRLSLISIPCEALKFKCHEL